MKFDLAKFLSDPSTKEPRDFINGIIDARVTEIIKQRMKKKDAENGDGGDGSNEKEDGDTDEQSANFFDNLFGVKKTK